MIYMYISILILITALWIASKVSHCATPVVETSYSKPFLASAVLIHGWADRIMRKGRFGSHFSSRTKSKKHLAFKLQSLNPGEVVEEQLYRYAIERTSTMILIIFGGCIAALIISITAMENGLLKDGNRIYRNAFDGADIEANLFAGIKGDEEFGKKEIDLNIPARKYTKAEADALFEKLDGVIDEIILGQNESLDHIVSSMNLVTTVDGYPFRISWECSNYECIEPDGSVMNDEIESPQIVQITADCAYENEHRYLLRNIMICPPEMSYSEIVCKEIYDVAEQKNVETQTQEMIVLPAQISYGELEWSENISDDSSLVFLFVLIGCVLIIPLKEAEVNSKIKERSRQLLIDYPSFVSKLTLYMGAGMSVRNCFIRMGHDYERTINQGGDRRYLGEELTITAHEIETGISEAEAYKHLGQRCGGREYMRFEALLTQNMKKGSSDLMNVLVEEASDAFAIRKNEARKLGEEASTKLLLPMVMLLGVVMIIIMVPAYMSFSA